jgi:hypothetical protein
VPQLTTGRRTTKRAIDEGARFLACHGHFARRTLDALRGELDLQIELAQALDQSPFWLSAMVAPSGAQLASVLADLPLHPTPFSHWVAVGSPETQRSQHVETRGRCALISP